MLAATGKLDKKALPSVLKSSAQGLNTVSRVDDKPLSETEKTMISLWSEILQFHVTDLEESFFDLGGYV